MTSPSFYQTPFFKGNSRWIFFKHVPEIVMGITKSSKGFPGNLRSRKVRKSLFHKDKEIMKRISPIRVCVKGCGRWVPAYC